MDSQLQVTPVYRILQCVELCILVCTVSKPFLKDLELELDIEDDDHKTIERNHPQEQVGCKRDMFLSSNSTHAHMHHCDSTHLNNLNWAGQQLRHFPHQKNKRHFWGSNLRHHRLAGLPVKILSHYANPPARVRTNYVRERNLSKKEAHGGPRDRNPRTCSAKARNRCHESPS